LDYNNRGTVGNGVFYSIHAEGLYNKDTNLGAQLSVESQSVKVRLGGWCEMAISLAVSRSTERIVRESNEKT
jgi:hypothetical protein